MTRLESVPFVGQMDKKLREKHHFGLPVYIGMAHVGAGGGAAVIATGVSVSPWVYVLGWALVGFALMAYEIFRIW